MPSIELPLKAWAAYEHDEGVGGIYFAKHAIVARRDAANEHADGELSGVWLRRAPWADRYAPGPVPVSVMIEHDWWFPCSHCDRHVTNSTEERVFDERDRTVWCSAECRAAEAARRAERLELERQAKEAAFAKFGHEITVGHTFTRNGCWFVSFIWPGGEQQADWQVGAETAAVAKRDLLAWEAWRDRHRRLQESTFPLW